MILVTGGTGLLGSHLLFQLTSRGMDVRALAREDSHKEVLLKIFSYYSPKPEKLFDKVQWVQGDVMDIFSLDDALDDVTQVYHCAAVVSFDPKEKTEMLKVNIDGTANLVDACLKKGGIKLCSVSSIASLGRMECEDIIDEETYWQTSKMNSAYSISKYGGEREVWRGIEEGLEAVIVNPSVILGPGYWMNGSSALFHLARKGMKFYPGGTNGYVDVKDVVNAMVSLMNSEIKGERFIVSAGNLNYKEFFGMVCEAFGKPGPSIYVPRLLGQIAWRADKIFSFLTRSRPVLTKETANTSAQTFRYSNEKIKQATGMCFIPLEQTISEICGLYIRDMGE